MKYLPIAFVSTPALCYLASDLAHVFIVLYYARCRVKDAKCKLRNLKKKNQIGNPGDFYMYIYFSFFLFFLTCECSYRV